MEVVTRAQAIAQNHTTFFTGKPCKYGHIDARRVIDYCCVVCHRKKWIRWADTKRDALNAKRREQYANDPEHFRNKTKRHYEANKPSRIAYSKAYYQANKEAVNARSKAYRRANKEHYAALYRESYLRSYPAKKAAYIARSAERRAAMLRATPPWCDLEKIKAVYVECARIAPSYVPVCLHVDHIVPLRGRIVCGLHVSDNLNIVSERFNLMKKNRFDQEYESARYLKWLKQQGL